LFTLGKRHLIVNQNAWMKEMAQILSKEFKPQGMSVTVEKKMSVD
jgi:hypothetical protein